MILTISGSQGQGKSTVLTSLEQLGYGVVPNKTARTILSDWGVSLEAVYSDKPLTVKFHEEIIKKHEQLCQPHYNSDEIVLIERSYADIFSYALAVLGPFNEYSSWLNDFHEKCCVLQSNFAGAFYLTGRTYTPQADGVRSTNIHFAKNIDDSIYRSLVDFKNKYSTHMLFNITSPDHEARIAEITAIIELYFGEDHGS